MWSSRLRRTGGSLMPRVRKRTQPIRATPGGTYGDVKAQEDAQRAQPLPDNVSPLPVTREVANPTPAGSLGDLLRDSERPTEPLTAGLAIGAGPGPEALAYQDDDPLLEAQAMYAASGSEELRSIVEELQTRNGLL